MTELEHLEEVENTLYTRNLYNAFIGAIKGALVGIAIGCLIGALLGVAAFSGFLPAAIPIMASHTLGVTVIAAAIKVGLGFGAITSGFGAVSGIQSTRDARHMLQADRQPVFTPMQENERLRLLQMSNSMPQVLQSASSASVFQDMVRKVPSQQTPFQNR